MNTKDVIGKKIIGVDQERHHDEEYGTRWYVSSFTLENGVILYLNAVETIDTPAVTVYVRKPTKKLRQKQEEKIDADA